MPAHTRFVQPLGQIAAAHAGDRLAVRATAAGKYALKRSISSVGTCSSKCVWKRSPPGFSCT